MSVRSTRVALGLAVAMAVGGARAELIFVDGFDDTIPTCGNHLVEPPETCDGSCFCAEVFTGFTSTGSPDSCNVVCHLPIQQCQAGDECCPFIAGSGGAQCGSASDPECLGTGWNFVLLRAQVDTTSQQCVTTRSYGAQAGASYDFTTCTPPGVAVGTGDPIITTVTDNLARVYDVGNDDCNDSASLPRLAGWSCSNGQGFLRMACASPSPSGFIVPAGAVVFIDVTVCRVGTDGGVVPLYIWYNGTTVPNPG